MQATELGLSGFFEENAQVFVKIVELLVFKYSIKRHL